MKPIFIALAAIFAIIGPASAAPPRLIDGTGAAASLPKPAIVLFWAAWCAPCRAEVRDYATLDKAAGNVPLIVLSTEGGARAQSLLANVPAPRRRFPADAGIDIFAAYPEMRGALPFAMAIDRKGQSCISHAGAIDSAIVAQWRDRCGR